MAQDIKAGDKCAIWNDSGYFAPGKVEKITATGQVSVLTDHGNKYRFFRTKYHGRLRQVGESEWARHSNEIVFGEEIETVRARMAAVNAAKKALTAIRTARDTIAGLSVQPGCNFERIIAMADALKEAATKAKNAEDAEAVARQLQL